MLRKYEISASNVLNVQQRWRTAPRSNTVFTVLVDISHKLFSEIYLMKLSALNGNVFIALQFVWCFCSVLSVCVSLTNH